MLPLSGQHSSNPAQTFTPTSREAPQSDMVLGGDYFPRSVTERAFNFPRVDVNAEPMVPGSRDGSVSGLLVTPHTKRVIDDVGAAYRGKSAKRQPMKMKQSAAIKNLILKLSTEWSLEGLVAKPSTPFPEEEYKKLVELNQSKKQASANTVIGVMGTVFLAANSLRLAALGASVETAAIYNGTANAVSAVLTPAYFFYNKIQQRNIRKADSALQLHYEKLREVYHRLGKELAMRYGYTQPTIKPEKRVSIIYTATPEDPSLSPEVKETAEDILKLARAVQHSLPQITKAMEKLKIPDLMITKILTPLREAIEVILPNASLREFTQNPMRVLFEQAQDIGKIVKTHKKLYVKAYPKLTDIGSRQKKQHYPCSSLPMVVTQRAMQALTINVPSDQVPEPTLVVKTEDASSHSSSERDVVGALPPSKSVVQPRYLPLRAPALMKRTVSEMPPELHDKQSLSEFAATSTVMPESAVNLLAPSQRQLPPLSARPTLPES